MNGLRLSAKLLGTAVAGYAAADIAERIAVPDPKERESLREAEDGYDILSRMNGGEKVLFIGGGALSLIAGSAGIALAGLPVAFKVLKFLVE